MREKMKPECFRCAFLVSAEADVVPEYFVSKTVYTCANGRYTPREAKHGTYYTLSGIIKPNKAVKKAQTDCPSFEEKFLAIQNGDK